MLQQIFTISPQPHQPPLFCLISPEASYIRLNQNFLNFRMNSITSQIKNAGKGLTEKRARVFCLWGEAFFCLDFWLLFTQGKVTKPRGYERSAIYLASIQVSVDTYIKISKYLQ